jgi:hypothetical protein
MTDAGAGYVPAPVDGGTTGTDAAALRFADGASARNAADRFAVSAGSDTALPPAGTRVGITTWPTRPDDASAAPAEDPDFAAFGTPTRSPAEAVRGCA